MSLNILTKAGFEGADMNGPCNGGGSGGAGAGPGSPGFAQFDGPFQFPPWAKRDGGGGIYGEGFFRQERVSGSNQCKTSPNAFYSGRTSCYMGAPGPYGTVVFGVFKTDFSGEYTLDLSGNPVGALQCIATLEGTAPGPRTYLQNTERTVLASGMDDLLGGIATAGIPFLAERFEEEFYNDQHIRRWINWLECEGWFVAAGCYISWCVAYEAVSSYTLKLGPDEV
jgi:hypothetical protein